jgi:protein-tyrosine-phosphatase
MPNRISPAAAIAPKSVLFACTRNAIRSPMAEALMKSLHGRRIYVQSAGVETNQPLDPLAIEAMNEIGIDLRQHKPRTFDDIGDSSFDLIVTLSPEAFQAAKEMARTQAVRVEHWKIPDPSVEEGSREQRLTAFRAVRDLLARSIRDRFPVKEERAV